MFPKRLVGPTALRVDLQLLIRAAAYAIRERLARRLSERKTNKSSLVIFDGCFVVESVSILAVTDENGDDKRPESNALPLSSR